MDILVLGATGVAGRSTLPALVGAGHHVTALARSEAKAAGVRAAGADPVAGDPEDDATLLGWLQGKDAVVDLRVKIPSATTAALPWAWREYVHLRDTATGQLVDGALRADVGLVVHDTVTMVYEDGGDEVVDESWPVDAPGVLAANLATERHLERVTAAGGRGVILRCGQFYGPDDVVSEETLKGARRGLALVLGPLEAWSSALHTDDIGPAVLAALDVPAGIYNVVDDEPMRRSDLLAVLAGAVGRDSVRHPPAALTAMAAAPIRALTRSQRVTAARFQEASGWRPTVPSRREGWPAAAAAR
jgi:nucleoside-diphosphate-sugar epimerase